MNNLPPSLTAQEKRELLAELLRRRSRSEGPQSDEVPAASGPISHGQRALWFVYQLDPLSTAYNILYAARVGERIDVAALQRASDQLISRHAALRTTYVAEGGQPLAKVQAMATCPFARIDASGWSDERLHDAIHAEADRPFDLEQGPVLRLCLFERPGDRHVLLLVAAHIVLDFWSLDLMFDELQTLYAAEVARVPASLAPVSVQYADFVRWQEEMLSGEEGERLWNYWREQLAGPLPALDLPTDRPRGPVQTFCGDTLRFELPDDLSRRLTALAKSEGVTLYMLVLAAFQALLFRWSGQGEILVGSSTAGRNRSEWEAAVGYFLNVIVLRGRIDRESTFQQFLAQVRETVLGALSHQDYPFPLLVQRLAPPRDVSRSPVFQVSFNWDRPRKLDLAVDAANGDPTSLGLEPFEIGQKGAAFDLTLVMLHRGESLSAALQYNSDLFDRATMARFAAQLQTLLDAVTANPRQRIVDLPLLTRSERQMLLEDWNDTAADYPHDACLHDLVTSQAAKTPERVAVVHAAGELTYGRLDERSNQLARRLVQLGVGPDVLVGVYVDRSPAMLVALLGVLKAGGAYVPLAIGTPAERLASMLQESQAAVVVTQNHLAADLPEHTGRTLLIDADWPDIERESFSPLERRAGPRDLAYVIFTSGSTGRPKGVQIEHRSVVNFLTLVERRPGIQPDDRLLAVTTLSFDISVLELFLPLSVGARVVIADRRVTVDGRALTQLIAECGATIMQATPATWRLLIQAGWQGDSQLKILCGGEALPRDLADQLLDRCGSLWNMYGPTETTIWSSVDRVTAGAGPVPVGRPMANTQFYVLDDQSQPTPIGIPGELYIGGDGVARGYLNRPELTAERFPSDPFHADSFQIDSPRRMFKTGDVVRYRADGRLEFQGRSDFQVKVRGFRIELGEIETVLAQHGGVRESMVVARQASDRADDKHLVAYFVSANGAPPGAGELREFLRLKLPDYMVPAAFVTLDALPLNASGKVDRKALPEPEYVRPSLTTEYLAPRNELEARLAEVWQTVLGVDRLGVNDDYFDLGGASMQSLEIGALAAEYGIDVAPALLFQHPTVAKLAAALEARGVEADFGAELAQSSPAVKTDETEHSKHTNGHASRGNRNAPTRPAAAPGVNSASPAALGNTIIESLGVYLPPNEVSTDEVLRGCRKRVWFPLERMSGIQSRRRGGEGDYAVDLARKAIERCLASSKYGVDDVDLVVSCSITRGKTELEVWLEPNISLQLKRQLGFKNAVAFDITNACGGMFTGILLADAWISLGAIRRAIVVSGEFITPITQTAQQEISSFLDSRIACLTVGDAGAAVLLEAGSGRDTGFHQLEMYSVSRHNQMCIGRLTEHAHGGPIMHVPDPIRHTSVSAEHSVMHARAAFQSSPWPPEEIQHLIIHQTSRRSLRDGMRAINKAFRKKVSHDGNTLDNLTHRGNTGSTTQLVALWDHIQSGRVRSGDNVVFAVSGSGQTIGTGLYTLDDLPDRIRKHQQNGTLPENGSAEKLPASAKSPRLQPQLGPRVSVRALGTHLRDAERGEGTVEMTTAAAEKCLAEWGGDRNDIDLVLFAGMLRTGYIAEPAIATFIAGEMKINDDVKSVADRKTLAFDVYNAALGTLNACDVAVKMIQAGKFRRALVTASEYDLNAAPFPDFPLPSLEAGSAMLLEVSPDGRTGFGRFVYRYATEHLDARTMYGHYIDGKPLSDLQVHPEIESLYLAPVRGAVDELLEEEGLTLNDVAHVLPSQFSPTFHAGLAKVLEIAPEKIVDLTGFGQDLFTSSLPMSLERLRASGAVKPGDVGLIVNVASGIQVGCATYYF